MTEELSLNQIIPDWMMKEEHKIFPAIDTILLRNHTLAVTRKGLLNYPHAFTSIADLIGFNADSFDHGKALASDLIRVSWEHPKLVLKWDVSGEAVNSLLTLSAIGRQVPRETNTYLFRPLDIYWAFDQPEVSIIAMEKVDPLRVSDQESHRRYAQARKQFIEDSRKAGFEISALPYQDLLYLGETESGKPIISIIDQVDPGILAKLS